MLKEPEHFSLKESIEYICASIVSVLFYLLHWCNKTSPIATMRMWSVVVGLKAENSLGVANMDIDMSVWSTLMGLKAEIFNAQQTWDQNNWYRGAYKKVSIKI